MLANEVSSMFQVIDSNKVQGEGGRGGGEGEEAGGREGGEREKERERQGDPCAVIVLSLHHHCTITAPSLPRRMAP